MSALALAAVTPFLYGPQGCAVRDSTVEIRAVGARPVFGRPDLARFYPERAQRTGTEGQLSFRCVVEAEKLGACERTDEIDMGDDLGMDRASRLVLRYVTFPSLLERTTVTITIIFRFLDTSHATPCPVAMP